METKQISICCKADITDDENYEYPICNKCENQCEIESVCVFCEGLGEVSVLERVYPNEPHLADIGTQTCICKRSEVYMDDNS